MFEDRTTNELLHLREKFLTQQTRSRWKRWYYVIGLLATITAVFLIFEKEGINARITALLILGLPAVWLWHRDDQQRAELHRAYKAVAAELEKRGAS